MDEVGVEEWRSGVRWYQPPILPYMVSLSRIDRFSTFENNAKTILTIEAWLRLGTRFCRHILFQRLSARFIWITRVYEV